MRKSSVLFLCQVRRCSRIGLVRGSFFGFVTDGLPCKVVRLTYQLAQIVPILGAGDSPSSFFMCGGTLRKNFERLPRGSEGV